MSLTREDIARMSALERAALLEEISAMVAENAMHHGDAVRILRHAVLAMDRATFAKAVKVSPRAIAELEDDPDANPTLRTLTKVFAPFGLKVGVRFLGGLPMKPPDTDLRNALLETLAKHRRAPRK